MKGGKTMKFDIIPFHDNYGINKQGYVINFVTDKVLDYIWINDHKCVYIDKIPYKIMDLLLNTYITLYDDFDWDYYDKDHNNTTLSNIWINIKDIHYTNEGSIIINNHLYLPIPAYSKYYISSNGTVFSSKNAIFMKKKYDVGYPAVSFPIENRKSKIYKIHRLVYCTWNHIPYNSVEVVHHKDSRKYNSDYSNLADATMFTNTRYAILDGQKPVQFSISEIEEMCKLYTQKYAYRDISCILFGNDSKYSEVRNMIYRIKRKTAYKDLADKYNLSEESIPSKSKLTEAQVHQICKKLELSQSCNSIAKEFDVSPNTIFKIRDRERWKDISKEYNF